jgi:hypothetical protein
MALAGDRRRKAMRGSTLLLFLLILCLHPVAEADAYRWRDADGQTHYGDEPTEGAEAIEQIETFECRTEACREDLEQRRLDTAETNQQIKDWLQSRQAERDAARAQEERASVIYMPTYQPYPPILAAPGIPCLRGRHCSAAPLQPGHRIPGRHHGGRPVDSDGHSSSRHSRRSYGFPAPK